MKNADNISLSAVILLFVLLMSTLVKVLGSVRCLIFTLLKHLARGLLWLWSSSCPVVTGQPFKKIFGCIWLTLMGLYSGSQGNADFKTKQFVNCMTSVLNFFCSLDLGSLPAACSPACITYCQPFHLPIEWCHCMRSVRIHKGDRSRTFLGNSSLSSIRLHPSEVFQPIQNLT